MKKIATGKPDGPITKALLESITLRRKLIDSGTPELEADRIVGQGLKSVLGNPRHEKWRFYCDTCRDTGMVEVEPDAIRMEHIYGKNWRAESQPTYRPCEPCRWRTMERKKRSPVGEDEDFVAAGQIKGKRR